MAADVFAPPDALRACTNTIERHTLDYRPTRLGGESRAVFYRSRFEMHAEEGAADPWQHIISILKAWIETKEAKRAATGADDAPAAVSLRTFAQGGTVFETNGSRLVTRALFADASGKCEEVGESGEIGRPCETSRVRMTREDETLPCPPTHWAMEYAERDQRYWYRTWYTSVGVTRIRDDADAVAAEAAVAHPDCSFTADAAVAHSDRTISAEAADAAEAQPASPSADAEPAAYAVNVRVSIADDPAYISAQPWMPKRTAPRFVSDILSAPRCVAVSGNTVLPRGPVMIGKLDLDWLDQVLLSDERTIPVVVISGFDDRFGHYPISPYVLEGKIRGAAIVCCLDLADFDLRKAYYRRFPRGTRAFRYRVSCGFVRIFFPGVDFDNAETSVRHRFYAPDRIGAIGPAGLANDICGAATRLCRSKPGEAISPASINAIGARVRLAAAERRFRREIDRLSDRLERERQARRSLHTESELQAAIDEAEERSRNELAEIARLYEARIAELEENAQKLASEDDVLELMIREEELEERARGLQAIVDAQKFTIRELSQHMGEDQRENADIEAQAAAIRGMQSFPSMPADSVRLARRVFANRLVVLDRAVESAEDFESGSPDEVFDILRCLAIEYWPICFEDDGEGGTPAQRFENATGYQMARGESSATNKDVKLKRMRLIPYKNGEIDISPHVKGASGKKKAPLRVHFAVDSQDRKIVVGYVGRHMETAGTRRVK